MTIRHDFRKLVMAPALALAASTFMVAPAQAQIPGLLPSIEDVTPLAPLAIDGMWRIREIDELIVVDSGHAYAVDGWTHALIFQIMPGQVVLTDLLEEADGTVTGRDLPLMAAVTLEPIDDMTIRATVHGLVPVVYHLDRADPDTGYEPPERDLLEDGGSWFPADEGEPS